jgi:hypothetical protein
MLRKSGFIKIMVIADKGPISFLIEYNKLNIEDDFNAIPIIVPGFNFEPTINEPMRIEIVFGVTTFVNRSNNKM